MMKGLIIDDNMSNLTFASGEISASSSTRNELSIANNINTTHLYPTQLSSASTTTQSAPPPPKKKRNLPGNPDPEAEVIALSPKTLLATNRFMCEICNKGFQRDQNLQLHRRGHNLPWKLKQRANKEVIKKKVYVCPEATCVHHDPSRALGDLTGIKKHFFRKHGEKKWKCDKCSKRYAVQSDWKAHSKICGTREYRCDCGTLFSRRDSFITHRAFCDALAQETTSTTNITARAMNALNTNNNNNNNNNNPLLFSTSSSTHSHLVLQSQLDSQLYGLVKREQQDAVNVVPQWLMSPSVNLPSQPPLFSNPSGALDHSFMQGLGQKPNPSSSTAPIINMNNIPIQRQQQEQSPSAFASATALLQKAAQMGATMSSNNNNPSSSSSSSSPFLGSSSIGVIRNAGGQMMLMAEDHPNSLGLHYDVMGSLQTPSFCSDVNNNNNTRYLEAAAARANNNSTEAQLRNGDGLTRDFLGLRAFPRREFFNMVGLDHHHHHHLNSSAAFGDHHHQQQKSHDHDHHQPPWQG